MDKHYNYFLVCLTALVSACQLVEEPTGTTVDGTIINKYTRQPLPNVPVEVMKWRYGSYGNTSIDSITGTRTDTNGHFHLTFDGNAKGVVYRADFRDSRDLYDLTDYQGFDQYSSMDGASLVVGRANQVNFEATPYVPVRVLIDADKQGRSIFQAYFTAEDGLGWFHSSILLDTTRTTQRVVQSVTTRALPNRRYSFVLFRGTPVRTGPYSFENKDVVFQTVSRYITYTDTTTVRLH